MMIHNPVINEYRQCNTSGNYACSCCDNSEWFLKKDSVVKVISIPYDDGDDDGEFIDISIVVDGVGHTLMGCDTSDFRRINEPA